jgi:hypothetical protein
MSDSHFLTTLQEQVKNGQKHSYLCFWGHSQKISGKIDKSCLSQWFLQNLKLMVSIIKVQNNT